MGALKKDKSVVRRNYLAFYANDSVTNWIEDSRGFESKSRFIHRKLQKLKRLEEDP